MIDLIGAIGVTAVYAIAIGVVVSFSSATPWAKAIAFALAAAWAAIIVTVAALGGFAPGVLGSVPTPVFASGGLLAVLFGSWFAVPQFRNALLSVPLPALVALHAARIGGIAFVMLEAQGRLSAPFAPIAGWGDIAVGLVAIPLAVLAWREAHAVAGATRLWNALGSLDLVVAVSLGALSAPGTAFRVFAEGPGSAAMTELPWVMIVSTMVPIYLTIHLTIAAKLRQPRPRPVALATS